MLRAMVDTIRHRGPDGTGECLYGDRAGLGFARLAIIDLVGGHQPFTTPCGHVSCVVNGEIYNHGALRNELKSRGYTFRTSSDCEVVLHGYVEWGSAVFERLEGMFAAAIWDDTNECLLLARDRIGKKPLYWGLVGSGIAFASEAKGLLNVVPDVKVDPLATSLYFVSDSVPTPLSIWSGISKLEPGVFLRWTPHTGASRERYWEPVLAKEKHASYEHTIKSLDECLKASTEKRLMADVPVGMLLSSGVDSLTVAAIARGLTQQPMHSFTLAFEDASYDESRSAACVADELGFIHHEVPITDRDLVEMFDVAVRTIDEPLNDPASLVMLRLAQAASATVKVALTGDGGDELFLGYPHIRVHALLERMPRALRSTFRYLRTPLTRIATSDSYMPLGFKAQRLARGLGEEDFVARDLAWRGAYTPDAALAILDRDFKESLSVESVLQPLRTHALGPRSFDSFLDAWSWMYLRGYLLDTVLVKVDRATMAYGVEARSPLLDTKFVESVLAIPATIKRRGLGRKPLLREVLRWNAPNIVPTASKHGMGVPTSRLLRGLMRERVHDYASSSLLARQGIFEQWAVRDMLREFDEGRIDRRKEVWGFLVFQAWYEYWNNNQRELARVG